MNLDFAFYSNWFFLVLGQVSFGYFLWTGFENFFKRYVLKYEEKNPLEAKLLYLELQIEELRNEKAQLTLKLENTEKMIFEKLFTRSE